MQLPVLDTDLLRALIAVADDASFVRAARRLGRSAPAISMQIARLEEQVGQRLFDRDTRSTRLTASGETLLGYARRIVALQAEALDVIRASALEGRLVIGTPDDYVAVLLPDLLRRFARLHPLVQVEVVCRQTTALGPMIETGEVDVAFVTRHPGVRGERLRGEKLVWVAAADSDVHLRRPLPVALYEPGSMARLNVIEALAKADIGYRAAYESASLPGLLTVVEAGLAVAALAASTAPAHLPRLDRTSGLPALPSLDIVMLEAHRPGLAARAFAALALADREDASA